MMKRLILATAIVTSGLLNLTAESEFGGTGRVVNLGDSTRDFVIKRWLNLSPDRIASEFGKKYNPREITAKGIFSQWKTHQTHDYDFLDWKLSLADKKWVIKGRPVLCFRAKFSKPLGKNVQYKAWDAFYVLGAKSSGKPVCLCPAPKGHKCAVHPLAK